jgi:hypothetical protein
MRRLNWTLRGSILAMLVCGGCAGPSSPSSQAVSVEVLAYLIGDAAVWPRVGSHAQNQIVDLARREICWVKYANPRRFECWRWDDAFVYHAVDHALDGDIDDSYSFSDGRWAPRHLSGLWTLDVPENRITWFDSACRVDPARSHRFPYRMRAWLEPARDAGGDLGVRDTLVLEYQPYDPAGRASDPERFYFAAGAGWYQWERANDRDLFNRRGGPAVPMARDVWCPAL